MFIYFLVPKTVICSKVITMIRKRNVLHIFPSKVKQGNPQEIIKTKNKYDYCVVWYSCNISLFLFLLNLNNTAQYSTAKQIINVRYPKWMFLESPYESLGCIPPLYILKLCTPNFMFNAGRKIHFFLQIDFVKISQSCLYDNAKCQYL